LAKKSRAGGGADELVYLPLGGAGEIGMNLYLYGFGKPGARQWLMVDLGVTFPGEWEPGVDIIMPDTRFIEESGEALVGILLTHAHEDHYGAVIDLWPDLKAPIYASPFAAGMLKAKIASYAPDETFDIREYGLGERMAIGPFDVELVNVAHSIPEPSALVIRAGGATVVHSGDWKIDAEPVVGQETDAAAFQRLGDEGVDVLVCDSTNVMRDGTSPTEGEVGRAITEVVKSAQNRVAITTFASNVARIRSVVRAAEAAGRSVVVAGRALQRVIEVSKDVGVLPRGLKTYDMDAFNDFRRHEVVLLCTGSQGEPRAAMARIAAEQHPRISLEADDTVIFSSRTIPGNEKVVGRLQNALAGLGVKIVTDSDAPVHVTGHPRRDELRQMYAWLRPKTVVPMHGEMRHLHEHVRFAKANGVPDAMVVTNGSMLQLAPGDVRIVDEVPAGRVYRDGDLILEGDDVSVRERRKLAQVGIVFASLAINDKGDVASKAVVEVDGVPPEDEEGEAIAKTIAKAVDGAVRSIPKARRRDPALVREAARRAARASAKEIWGKRPICKAVVHVI